MGLEKRADAGVVSLNVKEATGDDGVVTAKVVEESVTLEVFAHGEHIVLEASRGEFDAFARRILGEVQYR